MVGRTNRRTIFEPAVAAARLILLAGAATAVAGGCAPAGAARARAARPDAPRQAQAARVSRETVMPAPQRPVSRGAAAAALPAEDACAARLHDLSGLLLLYFATNKHLPDRLEDLAPLADPGTDFQITCPASGRPYVYVPAGLPAPGTGRVLLVYDAVPAHGGIRWVIAASAPQGDQPLSTWVMPFTEQRFRQHVPRSGG